MTTMDEANRAVEFAEMYLGSHFQASKGWSYRAPEFSEPPRAELEPLRQYARMRGASKLPELLPLLDVFESIRRHPVEARLYIAELVYDTADTFCPGPDEILAAEAEGRCSHCGKRNAPLAPPAAAALPPPVSIPTPAPARPPGADE